LKNEIKDFKKSEFSTLKESRKAHYDKTMDKYAKLDCKGYQAFNHHITATEKRLANDKAQV
jgi:hypothetical protein